MKNQDREGENEYFPKWTNYACPSCAIYYGVKALLTKIKKQKKITVDKVKPIRQLIEITQYSTQQIIGADLYFLKY